MATPPAERAQAQASKPHYRRPEVWETGFTGIRTFAGCSSVSQPEGVEVAIVGAPFDGATSFRPGARFGPEAIRAASGTLRGYHPALDIDVFAELSVVDWGDVADIVPGSVPRTLDGIARELAGMLAHDVVPIVLGGDHSIVLAELRAHAAARGPHGIVMLDAHADTLLEEGEGDPFSHGSPLRRAVEEGILVPERSVLAGMRGSVLDSDELAWPSDVGFDVISCDDLRELEPEEYAARVRDRAGSEPVLLSVDVDVVDPAFAPATGTPEVGGLASHELLAFVRSLAGMDFSGFDVVEVSPPYDNAGQTTALLAATVVYDYLALVGLAGEDLEDEDDEDE
ncbi:MAG TPA: agmatinase [Solirubrobacteraceae bacterium]|nr:agmatinase [Solirubrobacteraceae bacterium]